jgi:hypothetical protein
MLFRRTEDLVTAQPWYQNGYRANVVAYTIAKFAHIIQFEGTGELFDFKAFWSRQSLSPAIENQLTLIAGEVFKVIVSPEAGFQNVTEWAKKELCWTRVQNLRIPLLPELAKQLVGREEDKIIKATAETDQALKSGIELQTAVLNFGGEYWKKLQTWAQQRSLLSPDDYSIATIGSSIPRKIPTEKQCKRLMEIKARVESEGYPVV